MCPFVIGLFLFQGSLYGKVIYSLVALVAIETNTIKIKPEILLSISGFSYITCFLI